MRKLKIGLFLEHYDPFTSGVITYVKTLRTELERRGHSVYIICPVVRGYKDDDPQVIRILGLTIKGFDNTTVGVPTWLAARRIRKLKLDIVHSQEVYMVAALAYQIAKTEQLPFIQNFHTLWDNFSEQASLSVFTKLLSIFCTLAIYPPLLGLGFTKQLVSTSLKDRSNRSWFTRLTWAHMQIIATVANRAVVPSRHLQKKFLEAGITKTVLIPNGVSQPRPAVIHNILPGKKPGWLRVLCVARLSREKRVDVLIKAAKTYKKCELILIGDGPDRGALEKLAIKSGVGKRVRFMGELNNDEVRQIMTEADVLALASYKFDNQPMVIGEAVLAQLPIIYCDPDLTEGLGANSLLVAKTPSGFAKGFMALASDKIRRRMSRESKKLAEDFSIVKVADKLEGIYLDELAL